MKWFSLCFLINVGINLICQNLTTNNFLPEKQQNIKKDSLISPKTYPFILMDRPALLFTMRQMNENALSMYRMFNRFMLSHVALPMGLNRSMTVLLDALFFIPLTHEEGHRSILTHYDIGSISQPYFNKHGAAYVKGVTDSTLKWLRNTHFPDYIRLHSAGLESDYMMLRRIETLLAFKQENLSILFLEYLLRKTSLVQYLTSGLFEMKVNIEEEPNELDRDIVGHDVYGFARHLHRPNMSFYRYTEYHDLTAEEKKFLRRIGGRSLLNILHPLTIGIPYFKIKNNILLNSGLGYMLAPFGDFIDFNFWLSHKKWNIMVYVRGYQNKHTWFPAAGLTLSQFHLFHNFYMDTQIHFWQQPENLSFNQSSSFAGFAFDGSLQYQFQEKHPDFSLNIGMLYKTEGFLPEEVNLKQCFSPRLGLTILY